MALVQGPLHSDSASGTFAKSLTFASCKGRQYVRNRVTPANPRSAMQTGVRSLLRFMGPLWAGLGAVAQATWDAAAAAANTSGYNEYCRENFRRWQLGQSPTQASPAAEASTALTVTTMDLTGGDGNISIEITPSGGTAIWGIAIFRDDAEITAPSWANCIAIVPADGANAVTWIDSPIAAGTWHYRSQVLNTDGVAGTVKADATAVAT